MATPYAFVTLVTSDPYLPGALALVAALNDVHKASDIPFDTVCLVTPETVDVASIKLLRKAFRLVVGIELIVQPDPSGLNLLGRPDLDTVLTKLHVFRLVQYSKIIFLDADVLPIRPLSHLFSLPHEFSAVPDVGWPDIFNSGVLVLSPGEDKFTQLNQLLKSKGSWDGGDQGILNEWRGDDWNRLSFTYNTTPTAAYTYAPAYERYGSQISAIHFIGPNKPWKAYDYNSLVDRWFSVYDKHYRAPIVVPKTPFEVRYYAPAWDAPPPPRDESGRPSGGALSLDDLREMAIRGLNASSSSYGYSGPSDQTPGEGEYRSLPLDGRVDLIRPRIPQQEAIPESSPSPPPDATDTSHPVLQTLPTPGPNEIPPSPHLPPRSWPPFTPGPPHDDSGAQYSYFQQEQGQGSRHHIVAEDSSQWSPPHNLPWDDDGRHHAVDEGSFDQSSGGEYWDSARGQAQHQHHHNHHQQQPHVADRRVSEYRLTPAASENEHPKFEYQPSPEARQPAAESHHYHNPPQSGARPQAEQFRQPSRRTSWVEQPSSHERGATFPPVHYRHGGHHTVHHPKPHFERHSPPQTRRYDIQPQRSTHEHRPQEQSHQSHQHHPQQPFHDARPPHVEQAPPPPQERPRPASPPLLLWNPSVDPPPNDPPKQDAFPSDTYFPNAWDSAGSPNKVQSPGDHPINEDGFFRPPPASDIPNSLLEQGHYRQVTGESETGSAPQPDATKVKHIFPWENKPRYMPGRAFPEGEKPSPTQFVQPLKPEPLSPKPDTAVPSTASLPLFAQPPVPSAVYGLPTNLAFANAWDTVPSIQRYATKLVRPAPAPHSMPAPEYPSSSSRRRRDSARSWDERVAEQGSQDGDDEDEGDEVDNTEPIAGKWRDDSDPEHSSRSSSSRIRSRSGSISASYIIKGKRKEYRVRGVQTVPPETRNQAVQVSIATDPPKILTPTPKERKVSRQGSGSGLGKRHWNPATSNVLPPLSVHDAVTGTDPPVDQLAESPTVFSPQVNSSGAIPPGVRSPREFHFPTSPPPGRITPRGAQTPPVRTVPTKGKASSPPAQVVSPDPVPSSKTPGASRRGSSTPVNNSRPALPVDPETPPSRPRKANSRRASNSSTTSTPSSAGPISPPDSQQMALPPTAIASPTASTSSTIRRAGRVWDPARGVDVFKKNSEEVLARFLRMGSWEEGADARRSPVA
uniref:glycogenin glucosyltransferase n=1 Tax=Pleurotus djamor TaxID=34470 RepID=Q68SS4_PLEDJ|nr:putative glycogenin protein [Pleurotus djamor]